MKQSLASHPLFAALAISLLIALPVRAEVPEELEAKIRNKNAELQKLQDEILQYEKQLDTIETARKTLESEIQRLDVSRKKIATGIAITQNRIDTATLRIMELGGEISDKEERIQTGRAVIGSAIRTIGRLDEITLAERYLGGGTFTEAWEEADRLRKLHATLGDEVARLSAIKEALAIDRDAVAKEERRLTSYKRELAGQKTVLDENRKTQSTVLAQTKNKESEYQKILADKRAQELELTREISEYESALKYSLDPTTIPNPGSGVLLFPLDPSYMARCMEKQNIYKNLYCISQNFGNTAFAQSGAYSGKGHNGIDFGAPEGTKVVAALGGIVQNTGNTDLVKGCYSYGKWVLMRHANGLATLYAHLSAIGVVPGQTVGAGEFLGYSGKTGYATGPHLHFTVYASNAVKVVRLGDIKVKTNCASAEIPVAPTAAYLNPIEYL